VQTPAVVPFPDQGQFLEHIGPVHVREEGDELVLGLRVEGTVESGFLGPLGMAPG
jgi:hypothetical protein